ncbi:MAG: hypothetical protein QNJ31_00790 [Candidatus Caenarcaniphilales bacterium]|nr:hypothetical protein [Candidatus Caenarcaniphilales bacterium]
MFSLIGLLIAIMIFLLIPILGIHNYFLGVKNKEEFSFTSSRTSGKKRARKIRGMRRSLNLN